MRSEVDKGAVSAAWGVLALVLAGAAVAVWQNALPQGWKFPAWSAWVLGIAVVLAVYLCFASLFGLWPASQRAGHEVAPGDAGGALQAMSGSPGGVQAGGRARVRTRDVIIVNPLVPGPDRDEGVEGPKVSSS